MQSNRQAKHSANERHTCYTLPVFRGTCGMKQEQVEMSITELIQQWFDESEVNAYIGSYPYMNTRQALLTALVSDITPRSKHEVFRFLQYLIDEELKQAGHFQEKITAIIHLLTDLETVTSWDMYSDFMKSALDCDRIQMDSLYIQHLFLTASDFIMESDERTVQTHAALCQQMRKELIKAGIDPDKPTQLNIYVVNDDLSLTRFDGGSDDPPF